MESFARLVVALLGTALVINLIQGGPEQVGEWTRAKFLGKES